MNSTAVIGEFADRAERNKNILSLSVGAVLLADAAMAVRNLFLVGVFIRRSSLRSERHSAS